MQQVIFVINEQKSYIKCLGWPSVKPSVQLPLIVPLNPGGEINLTIDEKKYIAQGAGSGLQFTTDRFAQSSSYNITGALQAISVKLSSLDLSFAPSTGVIQNGGGYLFVQGQPNLGGAGALATWYLGPSSLIDCNSPSFDIVNGLGCGGGLILELGSGNPTDFIIHLEATVGKEDADGDGKFEVACAYGLWKKLDIRYAAPKIKIIIPEDCPIDRWHSELSVIQAIRFAEFWKLVRDRPRSRKGLAQLESIELVAASEMWLVLFDSNGQIHGGSLSDESNKIIRIPAMEREHLLIGLIPNRRLGISRL